jgi:UDP-N-acetylmuramate dehydrogenase
VILHPALKGVEVVGCSREHVRLRAMAGENWDDLVAHAVANGWGGIENLSLIPGSVGASVVQNIGAYGVEIKGLVECVEAVSIETGRKEIFLPEHCGFAYRHSVFKGSLSGRYIITAVVLQLSRRPHLVLDYPGVREAVEQLGAPSLDTIRQAVTAIRKAKLPDPARVGNAGSFFKNPVVDGSRFQRLAARFPGLPGYRLPGDLFKIPAGWLIERCGWRGRVLGRAAVHDQQALVLVNLGGATGREILELAERVRRSVSETFGVELEREVVVV